jgi:hypothetical protein
MNGFLDLYTGTPAATLTALGLDQPAIRVQGFFPAHELGDRIGRTAHALFLPASFEPRERDDVATLFPSKLADYTSIGLPVLVWGPGYSSALRWAAENPDTCLHFTELNPEPVGEAVRQLVADPSHAAALATAGMEAGRRYFAPNTARETLYKMVSHRAALV